MSRNNDSKVVVITGASAGVGRATARAFAARGAKVGLLARGKEGLDGAERDVREAGGIPLSVITDVADAGQIENAAEAIENEFGPIDVWVNNATATVFAPVTEITPEEFRRVTDVTYLGTVYGTMAALKRMKPRNAGAIVQVGSALAYRGIPLQSAYCGSKHAIQGFTESLRCELIHEKSDIRLTMVQLPALNTPQFDWSRNKMPRQAQPVPPIYQPEVAAEAIVYAANHDRRELNVGASTSIVILGNKLAPGFDDHYLGGTGYESQMTDEPADPDRPDNLFEPVPQDRGARGRFSDQAKDSSLQLWLATSAVGEGLSQIAEWVDRAFSPSPGSKK